jgi:predicted nucleotidyltransferase
MRHHEEALERYIARESRNADTIAVIVSGSLSRSVERADSDIDLYLLVAEERWARAFADQRLMYVETEDAGYEGGYFDVKLATLSYLDDVADRGDDPVRDSFAQARVAFSLVDDLHERLERATRVPEEQWRARMGSHIAQARLHGGYFLPQGVEHGDPMLIAHAAVHLATSASRALLALNRVLFSGPKYLAAKVAGLEEKPEGIEAALTELVTRPTADAGAAVLELLEGAADWPIDADSTLSTFILDNELAWRYRTPPPEYR